MGTQLFVRVECDSHPQVFGEARAVERPIGDETSSPPFYNEFVWNGIKKIVYTCPDCVTQLLGPWLAFVDAYGADPIQRKIGRPPKNAAAAPLPSVPTADPPAPIGPKAAPAKGSDVATPEPQQETPVDMGSNVVPFSLHMYPCPLCPPEDPHAWSNPTSIRHHVSEAHGVSTDDVIGGVCHACGEDMGSARRLSSHFGVKHAKIGPGEGRTLLESMWIARAMGDPHGTVAAAMLRIRQITEVASA